MGFKKVLTKRTIIWGATSLFLIAATITANVLMRKQYSSALNQVFGGKRPIVAEGDNGIAYIQDYENKDAAYQNGNKVTEKICEEGMILLKNENNALPLKANAKVSVFGKNSVKLVYGGSGSAAPDASGERKTIFDSLKQAGIEYNQTLVDFYNNNDKSGKGRSSNPDMENDGVGTLETGETAISAYDSSITGSYDGYKDAAIVVFSRIAGENWDLPRKASDNSERHYLELDNNERALLKHIVDSNKFEHIIVLMNGSNYIDLGFLKDGSTDPVAANKIDACINIGSPGASGIMALGNILTGKVNPSGKTVDLVYTNYKNDPTWQNFGGNFTANGDAYTSGNGTAQGYYLVEYEENIYMGYRYYETRGKDNPTWYNQNVVYPFGFGLSYTTFEEELVNKDALEGAALTANGKFEVEIKVKNTGSTYSGKQVVQVYAEAPYEAGKIEKAYKVLAGFGKTKLLAPGESDTVKVEIDPYYFSSFDNLDRNGDGFRGYTLDAGNYVFHCGTDSHTDFATFTKNLATTAQISKDPVTNKDVKPLFTKLNDEDTTTKSSMNSTMEELKRSDFEGTMPNPVTDDQRKIDSAFKKLLGAHESGNEETYTAMPTLGADNGLILKDLAGLEYNDPKWDSFLDQLTVEEMLRLYNEGCYSTADILRLKIPATSSADGPTGLVSFMGNVLPGAKPAVYGGCYYCSECLVAQTYNLELAKEEAYAIGNEALIGDERGSTLSYPGWYAPGVNLHRSPFSGRNTEYYSEDPLLCGKFAATVISGVQEKGVYANVKHFALNDQETHRSTNGISTWCNEQAMRELYLKPFEIAIKEGKSKGVMTSFNRIGTVWAGGDYRLVTSILRDEWGFVGSVICDFHTDSYMDSKQMLYAGGDLNLCSEDTCKLKIGNDADNIQADNVKDVNLLRRASHNLLYCIANSNAMKADVVGYKNPIWENVLTGVTIGISVGIVGWGAWAILSSLLKKEEVVAEAAK